MFSTQNIEMLEMLSCLSRQGKQSRNMHTSSRRRHVYGVSSGYLMYQNRRKLIINTTNNSTSSEVTEHCSGSQETFLLPWYWRFVTLFMRGHIEFYPEWHKFSLHGLGTFEIYFNINLLLMPRSPRFLQYVQLPFVFLNRFSNSY